MAQKYNPPLPRFQSFRKYEVPLAVGPPYDVKGLTTRGMEVLRFKREVGCFARKVPPVIDTFTVIHMLQVPSVIRTASITNKNLQFLPYFFLIFLWICLMNQCINRYGSRCLSPGRFVPNRETDNTWTVGAILSLALHVAATTGIQKSCQLNQIILIHQNISALVCCNQRAVTKCTCSGRLTGLLHFCYKSTYSWSFIAGTF